MLVSFNRCLLSGNPGGSRPGGAAALCIGGPAVQAEGPEPLTRLCSPAPAPPCRHGPPPGSHTSCHAHPTLALAEGSRGPDAKKGWQQWAQRAPPRRSLAESGGPPGSPRGGGLGREALLAGPALSPCYPRQLESLSQHSADVPKPPGSKDSVHHLPGPSLPPAARPTQHPLPGHGTLSPPGQPLPRPLPPLLLSTPQEAFPASVGPGPHGTGLHCPPTPPLGHELWETQALGALSLSEGPAQSRGRGGRAAGGGWLRRPLPAGPRPGQGLTSQLCVPRARLMPASSKQGSDIGPHCPGAS